MPSGLVTLAASLVLCGALTLRYPMSIEALVALLAGLSVGGWAAWEVVRRRPLVVRPADRVTLVRAVLGAGAATVGVGALLGVDEARPWLLIGLALPAWLLDAVDGVVARRTGTAHPDGADLDMQCDARLLLVLSLAVFPFAPWALLIGLMRYLFVVAKRFVPALAAPLEFSQFRRVVAALQGAALLAALVPVTGVVVARIVVSLALALLLTSFGRDVVNSLRAARGPVRVDRCSRPRGR